MKISIYQQKRKNADGRMSLFFTINNRGKRAFIDTGIRCSYPVMKTKGAGIGIALDRKEPSGKAKMKRLENIFWKIDEYCVENPNATPETVKDVLYGIISSKGKKGELLRTMLAYAESDKLSESTAAIIRRTAEKVEKFDTGAGFTIDADWLDRFSSYLRKEGASTNGIGLHLRNIRTVFNYARRKKMTKEYPFLDYAIKEERQPVRAMSADQVREFKDYPCEAWQVEYRDIFMLSFCLCGMNIGDMLTCEGLVNGRVIYKRKKTDHPISLPVYPEAMAIIEKYKGKDYLINPCDRYKDYHGYLHRMNDGLKKIGKVTIVPDKVGKLRKRAVEPFFDGLSTYVARYSFASVAAECGVQRDVIAACLGHSWSDVTSHYVAYSQKQIDDAVRKVLDYIYKK